MRQECQAETTPGTAYGEQRRLRTDAARMSSRSNEVTGWDRCSGEATGKGRGSGEMAKGRGC